MLSKIRPFVVLRLSSGSNVLPVSVPTPARIDPVVSDRPIRFSLVPPVGLAYLVELNLTGSSLFEQSKYHQPVIISTQTKDVNESNKQTK